MKCTAEARGRECTCTSRSCDKHGKCCLCVAYHRRLNELPCCFFPPEAERSYDRSIECFKRCAS